MKKIVIGSIIGAIIVFALQFLSWTVLPVHSGQAKYTTSQDTLLTAISGSLKESGVYMIPNLPADAPMSAHEEFVKKTDGQPWASITYVNSFKHNMGLSMLRAFLIDLVLVVLLIYIVGLSGTPNTMKFVFGSVALGLFTFLSGPYMMHNWFQTPMDAVMGHLVDAIVIWGIVGFWLGWWINRK